MLFLKHITTEEMSSIDQSRSDLNLCSLMVFQVCSSQKERPPERPIDRSVKKEPQLYNEQKSFKLQTLPMWSEPKLDSV